MRLSEIMRLYPDIVADGVTFTPRYACTDRTPIENDEEEIIDYEIHGFELEATSEEVYQESLNPQEPPVDETANKISHLEKENKLLKAQVEVLSQTADFHEELIVEMANKVYA